jgi:cell division protein FtsB
VTGLTAVERFKWLLANALERVCVLEEQLEAAQARIAELEQADATE